MPCNLPGMRLFSRLHPFLLILGVSALTARGAFSSFYVFGDGVSTTTDNVSGVPYYYGNRYCNGRVWVEVLAQRIGLTLPATNNHSFFGHYSRILTNSVNTFTATDTGTALFVVWISDADFFDFLANSAFKPYTTNNIAIWTNAMNQSISNQLAAVETLYNKGARTLVIPPAVDITKTPYYDFGATSEAFVRDRIMDFNTQFKARLLTEQATRPGLKIIIPDFFATADNVIGNPGGYGMTNSTDSAIFSVADTSLSGPGTNFVFWDDLDPGAKTQEVLADTATQLISPVRITGISQAGGSNQLSVVNVPIGLNGVVEISTNLPIWDQALDFVSTNATQTISIPASGPMQFYRLKFPFVWSWP
jgi:hypothetical protein